MEFLYFDMGNVLLPFSHERMAEQLAHVAGTDPHIAWRILFEDGLHWSYERGEFSREQFYSRFCEEAGVPLGDIQALDEAGNDIFQLNAPLIGLVGKLRAAGYRLGVLSNTSASHWAHCTRRFRALTSVFGVHALSYEFHALKPAAAVYAAAQKLAGVPAEQIFFTDDRPENAAAALAAGWDAVPYESVSQLNEALRQRGIRINY